MARSRSGRRGGGGGGGGRRTRGAVDLPRRRRYNLRPTRRRRLRMLGGDCTGRTCRLMSDEEFRKRIEALKVRLAEGKVLKVSSIDLNKESNRKKHHTDEYEREELIVRRGQPFDLSITFNRPINKETDNIVLQLTTGARPQETKGSLLRLPLLSKKKPIRRPRAWTVDKVEINGDKVTASVTPFPRAIVGSYDVYVETKSGNDDKVNRYEHEEEDIYVLFNAWCKEDPVYMDDEKARQEYVLLQKGRIWVGSAWHNRGKPWNFGQFVNPSLDAALSLLDRAELGDTARGSAVSVLRTISDWTNQCGMDDEGVLIGNWSGDYAGGTSPSSWIGSVAILKEFMATGKPVKYGQCWVFSGITTTLCRALGIPTRSVTNFASAHDTDCSMTIDKHYVKPEDEEEDLEYMDDSTWNFHVWNESWLRRLDLPTGYDGWQAHDGTPQEASEGVMRCGPASLTAIKKGHVYLSYDTGFIFSEVNGDKINWEYTPDGWKVMQIMKHAVGKCISTKAKGSDEREDVTHLYKHKEGTPEEREVVKFVNRFSSREEVIYEETVKEDVEFTLQLPKTSVTADMLVTMVVKNTSNETRTVKGRMSVLSAYYTGVSAKRLKGEQSEIAILPKQQEKIVVKVTTQEFQSKLNPEANFTACANYKIVETGQRWADTEGFSLTTPPLYMEVPEEIHPNETYAGKVSFTNPLNIKLTGCSIQVEGDVAVASQIYNHKKAVAPKESITFEFEIKPRRYGRREVEASFSSDQLTGVDGSAEFTVT